MRALHLHLISDSTGETVGMVARAAVAQFERVDPIEHNWSLVRTQAQIVKVLEEIKTHPGVVLYTLVEADLRDLLESACRQLQVPCVSVLAPVAHALSSYLGEVMSDQPGRQHAMDEDYFQRIEAMQFTLAHDDGQSLHDIGGAEVILVGVSRTSKTPTCMYLANRGIKTANVPYVPGRPFPDQVLAARNAMIVGLTANPNRLVEVRQQRLQSIKSGEHTDYVDFELVREEITEARRLYNQHHWPVIDVSRRSIEETAAAVLELYRHRNGVG